MALSVVHAKTNNIAAWTQADLDAQIALGKFPPGTLISDITLSSDWNTNHTLSGSIAWGEITGTLSAQTDLQSALNAKQAAGTYVTAISIASSNGFAGSSSGGATPALTLSTTVTGIVKGNGTSFSAATDGTDYLSPAGAATVSNKNLTSGTNTFPTFNQNTTGSAAKWTTARNLAGNSVDGSANVAFANKFIVQGTTDAGLSAAQFLGALGTGILKNTTTTGVLSIAIAADFPTLNQSTTGNAATATALATPRAINGVNFDGTAPITVTAAAGTLTGTTLNATVVSSSLTSVGTLTSLTVTGNITNSALTASKVVFTSASKNLTSTGIGTSSQFIKGNGSLDSNTYLTGNQTITLSGDVSGSGTTAITATIGANKVTNSMLAQMSAHTYKGNNTGSTANAADITSTQLTADLNQFSSTLQGLVPLSGGGTTNFLRADGTWAAPSGGGSSTLNGITAATAANTPINSADYAQTWNWTLTTASNSGMEFGEDSAATNGAGAQSVVKMSTLASSTAMPLWIVNAGAANTFEADANSGIPFVIDKDGKVGMGTATPGAAAHIAFNSAGSGGLLIENTNNSNLGNANSRITFKEDTAGASMYMGVGYWNGGDGANFRFSIGDSNWPTFLINDNSGATGIGSNNTAPFGTLLVKNGIATTGVTKMIVQAGEGQSTTNLMEFQANAAAGSAGTVLSAFDASGGLTTTGPINSSITTTSTSAPASIDAMAQLGEAAFTYTPSAANSAGFYTGLMRKTAVSSANGAWTSTSHAVAGFDYLTIAGNNNISQLFCHEARIENNNTATLNELGIYKPILSVNAGTISNLYVYEVPDISGLSNITNAYIINNTQSNFLLQTSGLIKTSGGDQQVIPRERSRVVTGRYYPCENITGLFPATTHNRNVAYYAPWVCPERTTWTKIGFTNGTGQASAVGRLGIYKDDGASGGPGTLILDAGTVAAGVANTGALEITISQLLDPGIYWLALSIQGAAADNLITYASVNSWNCVGMPSATAQDGLYLVAATGALPNPASASPAGGGFIPHLWLRK